MGGASNDGVVTAQFANHHADHPTTIHSLKRLNKWVVVMFSGLYFTLTTRYLLVLQNICGLVMRSTYCPLASFCRL